MATPFPEMIRRAARLGELEKLIKFHQSGRYETKDSDGIDALMHAARSNQRECVLYLLGHSSPLARSKDGKTALMHASQAGAESCIPLLLNACDPLALDRNKRTALIIASTHNRLGAVRLLAPHSLFSARDLNGRTALAHACISGLDSMSMLLVYLSDLSRDMPIINESIALARATRNEPIAASIQLWLDAELEANDLAHTIKVPRSRFILGSELSSGVRQRL